MYGTSTARVRHRPCDECVSARPLEQLVEDPDGTCHHPTCGPAASCLVRVVVTTRSYMCGHGRGDGRGTAPSWPAVLVTGALATAAAAVCVERLLTSERRARQAAVEHQAAAAELRAEAAADKDHWERWLASVEEKHGAELSALYARLAQVSELHKAQLLRLAEEFLPRAVEDVLAGAVIDDALRPLANDPDVPDEFRAAFRKVLRSCLLAVEEEFDHSSAARNSVISIGSRLQVYTNKIRAMLHEMQGVHYGIPAVARDLMDLDQEIGPADCLAASIVVLGGADRPGRQWQTPQPLPAWSAAAWRASRSTSAYRCAACPNSAWTAPSSTTSR